MKFNELDYIIMIISALSVLIGYRKGLINSLGGVVSTLAGLGIAFLFHNPAANYLEEHFSAVSDLTLLLEQRLFNSADITQPPSIIASLPIVNEGMNAIHRQINEFAYMFVATLCFLLLFVISSQLIKICCLVLERILHWGIMGSVNRLGGALIIFARNVVIMAVLAGVLVSPLELGTQIGIKSASQAESYMNSSVLVPYLLKTFDFMKTAAGRGV